MKMIEALKEEMKILLIAIKVNTAKNWKNLINSIEKTKKKIDKGKSSRLEN